MEWPAYTEWPRPPMYWALVRRPGAQDAEWISTRQSVQWLREGGYEMLGISGTRPLGVHAEYVVADV